MIFERLEFSNPYLRILDTQTKEKEIVLRHGHIAITNYEMGDNPQFEKLLSIWNKMYWRYDRVSGHYIKELKEFRIGRGFSLPRLTNLFPNHKIRVDNEAYKTEKVDYSLTVPPNSDFQRVALTFMASQSPYKRNKDYTQQLIDAETGAGKAQPDNTLIPTPKGWRMLGDLEVGDQVFNLLGMPVNILAIYPQNGLQKTYRVTLNDGRTTRCNIEHLWVVIHDGTTETLPLSKILQNYEAIRYYLPAAYHPDTDMNMRSDIWISKIDEVEPTYQRCILINDPDHIYLTENYIPTHNTYCGAAISAYFKAKVVVICPISKLLGQWKDSFTKFTTLTEDQIMIVKGSKMCEKIRQGKCKDKAVFIFTSDTIMSYLNNYGEQACIEMMNQTGAFIKIIDEIHKDMKIVSSIEAVCNFRMNYYMSASPRRTDEKENFIFNTLYTNVPRFGADFKRKEENHINIIVKQYRFVPDELQIRSMYNPKLGLNTKAYEKNLITATPHQREDFELAVKTMLHWSKDLLKKGNKVLILCQTVDGTKYMEALADQVFKGKCSHYYATGMTNKQKEAALEATVICATASSMGTGADVAGLQHVINICTYSNPIDATQLPGRARKLKDGTPVVYIELVNTGYRKTIRQYEARRGYLNNKAANGKILVIK